MARHKKGTEDAYAQRIIDLITVTQATSQSDIVALSYINSGLLGFKTDKQNKVLKDVNGKPIPITISKKTFYKYKPFAYDVNLAFDTMTEFAKKGYTIMMEQFRKEMLHLHQLSFDNLSRCPLDEPVNRQRIISSIVKDVLPGVLALCDIIKDIIERNKMPKPEKDAISQSKQPEKQITSKNAEPDKG